MCSSWGVPNDCCYCEAKLFCPHPTMTFRPQIWIVLCCNHQNLWLLPSWLKMSPLKCLLTLTSPANTWGKATMVVVVITSKILILIVVVTVIVATLLLQFSAVPFPTEHVTSSSHKPSKTREREKCRQPAVTNPASLWKQIHFCSHDKSDQEEEQRRGDMLPRRWSDRNWWLELGCSARRGRHRRRIHRWPTNHTQNVREASQINDK